MKVLNISLDKNLLDKNSAVSKRMIEYGNLVDKFTVLVLADKNNEINLNDKVKIIAIKKSFCKIYNFLKLKNKARKILAEKYNLITVQDAYFVGWLALKLARKFNTGLEVQVHGFEKLKGIRKILAKQVLKNATAIRVVSQRLKKMLIDEFKVVAEKITVVSIHTNSQNSKVHKVENNQDNKFIFLTVGRLVPVKNVKMQIKAMEKVVEKYSQAELWIVGDGKQREALKHEVETRLIASVKFQGWQDDLDKFYNQADAFLLTSNSEGWGMVVVEAASFGLPIIMTDVGLAGEVIKDGESGIVIPVGDQRALEEIMIKIIEDENLRKKLGDGAREAIKELPTKEETLKLMKRSWEKAIHPVK